MIFWRLFFFKMFLSTSFANSAFYKPFLGKMFRDNFVDNRLPWVRDDLLDMYINIFKQKKSGFINKLFMLRKGKYKNV